MKQGVYGMRGVVGGSENIRVLLFVHTIHGAMHGPGVNEISFLRNRGSL
jgi:hypothetical protein